VYDRSKMKKNPPSSNGSRLAITPTIEDVEDLVPVRPTAPVSDGGQPWEQPFEADASEFEQRDSPWESFYTDALLRLEKTPKHKAIVYPFRSEREAERGYEAIARRARARLGKGHIVCGVRRDPPPRFCPARAGLEQITP
jgi:hypothetical protein